MIDATLMSFYVLLMCSYCRSLTVAANSEEEKERWLEDLNMAIAQTESDEGKVPYLKLKSCSESLFQYQFYVTAEDFEFNYINCSIGVS